MRIKQHRVYEGPDAKWERRGNRCELPCPPLPHINHGTGSQTGSQMSACRTTWTAYGNEENWAPPTENLTGVWEGLLTDTSNKFQGDVGAGGLGTIPSRNTNLMKLTVSVLGNFSSYIRRIYLLPKTPGNQTSTKAPKLKVSELLPHRDTITLGLYLKYSYYVANSRMFSIIS